MMAAYYNDNDPYVCAWLHNLIRRGLIAPGIVDPRSITEVEPHDLAGYQRCHFFAGIAGWDLALRIAGWPDDVPVWTASCPCQPYSTAGKRLGDRDPRDLWPEFYRLVRECRPPTIFGEQVAAAIEHGWLDGVLADLERENYACGAAVLGAHSIGSPHRRQRLYWVANAAGQRLRGRGEDTSWIQTGVPGKDVEPAYLEYHGHRISTEPGDVPLVDAIPASLGRDEPELRRLVQGARANRTGRIRAYGNAIVPELAAEFVRAAVAACNDIVGGGAVIPLRFRDESEVRKLDMVIGPDDCVGATAGNGAAAMNGDATAISLPNRMVIRACGDPTAVVIATAEQIPDVGDLTVLSDAELWTRVELEGSNIRRIEREIAERDGYLTAARYRRGLLLLEIKRRCVHGDFEAECKARKVKSQRASEDMRIAEYFPSEEDAGKVSVRRALALIKRSDDSYGPYENCFACPQWLRDAVTRDYGFPGLDVASSHGMHFGERYYTPEDDGLVQDWTKDCGGKIVWCNPPYNASVLHLWVRRAREQSQNGCVVVSMLPFWRNYDWFWDYVKPFAEVRIPGDMVVLDGFGPKTGKQCGNVRGPTDYETIIAVFRKDQRGFLSGWIEAVQPVPETQDQRQRFSSPLARKETT